MAGPAMKKNLIVELTAQELINLMDITQKTMMNPRSTNEVKTSSAKIYANTITEMVRRYGQ